VDRDGVMTWVDGYEQAWRASDTGAVARLFAPGATYRRSPVEPPITGLPAIEAIWAEDDGHAFEVSAQPVAVDGAVAVVRVQVRYAQPPQEYVDLWLLRFADDGRVAEFEEWPYWPGRGYTAAQER